MPISQGSIGAGGPVGLSLQAWALVRGTVTPTFINTFGSQNATVTSDGNVVTVTFTVALADSNYLVDFQQPTPSATNPLFPRIKTGKSAASFQFELYDAAGTLAISTSWGSFHFSVWR